MRWKLLVAAAIALVGVALLVLPSAGDDSASNEASGVVPDEALEVAFNNFKAMYAVEGQPASVVAEGQTTREEWAELEPGNTEALSVTPSNAAEPVYAVTVEGSFQVVGPVTPQKTRPVSNYINGRIIFDATGEAIMIQLRQVEAQGAEPFGDPAYTNSGNA